MSTQAVYPTIRDLRTTIELHILDLFESDRVTLKDSSEWPGYYTLPNTDKVPAVFVAGQDMVPSDWETNGIECVIEDVPEITVPGSFGGVVTYETWSVRFTNYGSSQGTRMTSSLREISRRLIRAFPRDQVTYMARTEATFEALTARIKGAVLNPPNP